MELMQVNRNWLTRPADERFVNLYDLRDSVSNSRSRSRSGVVSSRSLKFAPVDGDSEFTALQVTGKTGQAVAPTHWAFGQLANKAGFRANDLRGLPSPLTADILNYKLGHAGDAEDLGVLIGTTPDGVPETLRAATGAKYGRVWNEGIATSLTRMFGDGVSGDWKVPGEFGKAVAVTKENTTLYASDRDMFVFLADETNRIEIPNRRSGKAGSLARGFFVWNSETGSQSFGMAAFLFDYVCCNRIVWGVSEFKESRFRHTVSAPDKWQENVLPMISAYAESSARPYEAALIAAQNRKIDSVKDFMESRFSNRMAGAILKTHEEEEGRPVESIWDAATAITAYARNVPFQDERVAMERIGGKVLDLVAA